MNALSNALIISDAPDLLVLGVWLAVGLIGFAAGAVLVMFSLRRVNRRPASASSSERISAANDHLAAA